MAAATTRVPASLATSTQPMRAIVQNTYGDASVLSLGSLNRPAIGPAEVLVQVRAAGLDRGTWHMMAGLPYLGRLAFGLRSPNNPVPGLDLAGVVVATGAEVTRLQVGDEVFGIGKGSFAEFAAARADKLVRKPAGLTFEQAAAVPVSGLTALQALTGSGRVQSGQRVLIVGASGGVGTFAVQIARALGAHVTGVCSTAKMDLVAALGAERVIDYTRDDFADGTSTYDLVLDIGGNTPVTRLRRALTARGTLVIVGGEGGGKWLGGMERQLGALARSPFTGQRLTTFISKESGTDLERLATFIDNGQLVPVMERTYPLADVPEAMRQLAAGQVRGKLVITI